MKLNRFQQEMVSALSVRLGSAWTVEMDSDLVIARHVNRSQTVTFTNGDGRKPATAEQVSETLSRLRSKLAGSIPHYTDLWADRAREALASWPAGVAVVTASITYPSQVRPADFDTWADDEGVKDMTPTTLRMNLRIAGRVLSRNAETETDLGWLAQTAASALIYAAELLRREQNGEPTHG